MPINPPEAVVLHDRIVPAHSGYVRFVRLMAASGANNGGRFNTGGTEASVVVLSLNVCIAMDVMWSFGACAGMDDCALRRPVSDLPAHSEAASAAETFAMHRMTQPKSTRTLVAAIAFAMLASVGLQAQAQMTYPPMSGASQSVYDYEASGYVVPAGMVPPAEYTGGAMPAYAGGMTPGYPGGVMPVGFFAGGGCDTGCCDMPIGCDGCGMACGSGQCGCGGLIGKLRGDHYNGMSNLRHACMFCRGDGCSVCQSIGRGYLLGAFNFLRPYDKQGICAQRWYDLSVEAIFLGHGSGSVTGNLTTQGVAPGVAGDPVPANIVVLRREDANDGNDLEAGARISASMIWGPGGNLEATYIGGNKWNARAEARSGAADLYSFISDFGRDPVGGFDDTDQSIIQGVEAKSEFHSAEFNYRRRTVGPYCRFQGSWLVGLRYVRYDDTFNYFTADGGTDFFSSLDQAQNNYFGPQVGFDLWWNAHPGINLGMGFKGAWVQLDGKRVTTLSANSLAPIATPGSITAPTTIRKGTTMAEFEMKAIYRLTHSIALRGSYFALAVDDAIYGTADLATVNAFLNSNFDNIPTQTNSLVVQGVSFGAEYTW